MEHIKNIDINISIKQWPCTIAILGMCATYAFVAYMSQQSKHN